MYNSTDSDLSIKYGAEHMNVFLIYIEDEVLSSRQLRKQLGPPLARLPSCLELRLAEPLDRPRPRALADSEILLGRKRQRLVDSRCKFFRGLGVIS